MSEKKYFKEEVPSVIDTNFLLSSNAKSGSSNMLIAPRNSVRSYIPKSYGNDSVIADFAIMFLDTATVRNTLSVLNAILLLMAAKFFNTPIVSILKFII
jgi:hypothetical protein